MELHHFGSKFSKDVLSYFRKFEKKRDKSSEQDPLICNIGVIGKSCDFCCPEIFLCDVFIVLNGYAVFTRYSFFSHVLLHNALRTEGSIYHPEAFFGLSITLKSWGIKTLRDT